MNKNQAWNDYWQGKAKVGAGCLPCANDAIAGAVESWWHDFANMLERKGRILDLATGNGIVLQKILAKRPKFKAIGIDAAPKLPAPVGPYKLRGSINMENIPYADGEFDAITSQFGIEYGDLDKIAAEISRLLKSGGQCAFIMHRKDGPIVRHNVPRLESLSWACRDRSLPQKARNWVKQRPLLGLAIPEAFVEAPAQAAQAFGSGSAGHEFATALLRSLAVGQRLPPQESFQMIDELETMANNEMGRIESLMGAAIDEQQLQDFADRLAANGLNIDHCSTFEAVKTGADFAWLVRASKD